MVTPPRRRAFISLTSSPTLASAAAILHRSDRCRDPRARAPAPDALRTARGAEQVHPDEQGLVARRGAQVVAHLGQSLLAFGELDPAVFEVERPLLEAHEAALIDEKDGRREKRRRAVAVRSQQPGPSTESSPAPCSKSGRMYFPVSSEVTEYDVCGVGQ